MANDTKFDEFQKSKGQSAIEYLMTYGWMLLVVAIVGGAIFATVQGQCQKSSTMTGGTSIEAFGLTTGTGAMQIQLNNAAGEPLNITKVTITDQANAGNTVSNTSSTVLPRINVGASQTVYVDDGAPGTNDQPFSNANGCNTFDVEVFYDQIGGLSNQKATGTVTGQFQFN